MAATPPKKGVTGEDVGRLMVTDLIQSYANTLSGAGDEGLLTETEKANLVEGLSDKQDIRQYNDFRFVHDYSISLPIRYTLHEQLAENAMLRLFHLLDNTRTAEHDAQQRVTSVPRIVTQQQYNALKQADLDTKLQQLYSVEQLMLHAILYFLTQYQSGTKTPFDKHFIAANNTPVPTLPNWQQGQDGFYRVPYSTNSKQRAATAHATLYDVLTAVHDYYHSAVTGNDKTFYQLAQDAPALYNAVWQYLCKKKDLAFLSNVPQDAHVSAHTIPMKMLYDNNLLDFRKFVNTFDPAKTLHGYRGGIAILQNADNVAPPPPKLVNYSADVLVDTHSDNVRDWIDTIKTQYREMYAIHTFLIITSEFINVPNMDILVAPIEEQKLDILNALFADFPSWLCDEREGGRDLPTLTAALRDLLHPIQISDLQPTKTAIQQARDTLGYDTFKGNASAFIRTLVRGSDKA